MNLAIFGCFRKDVYFSGIINDEVLLTMIKEGKTQREIAEHFHVSAVAVSKRIKRLTAPSPEQAIIEKHGLTGRQAVFAIEKAKGKSSTSAALMSYEVSTVDSAKAIGSELMKQEKILTAIDELMSLHGLTKDYRIGKLKTLIDHPDPNIVCKGLEMSFRLDNSFAPEKIAVVVDHHLILEDSRKMSNEIARMEAEIERLERGQG
jgi:predicted transcriptional regulator